MQSTQAAPVRDWAPTDPAIPDGTSADDPVIAPECEHDGQREIARLRVEIERIVRGSRSNPRETLDTALESVTRLQVATANIEACGPMSATWAGSALVALADARLRGHADAIERGMTYTADNQLQLLRGER